MRVQLALAANAVFSAVSACIMVLGGSWLSQHIPLPNWLWLALGAGLGLFSVQLFLMALKPKLAQLLIKQVVISDVFWVVAVSLVASWFITELSATGVTLVMAVNAIVGCLAYLQHKAWKHQAAL